MTATVSELALMPYQLMLNMSVGGTPLFAVLAMTPIGSLPEFLPEATCFSDMTSYDGQSSPVFSQNALLALMGGRASPTLTGTYYLAVWHESFLLHPTLAVPHAAADPLDKLLRCDDRHDCLQGRLFESHAAQITTPAYILTVELNLRKLEELVHPRLIARLLPVHDAAIQSERMALRELASSVSKVSPDRGKRLRRIAHYTKKSQRTLRLATSLRTLRQQHDASLALVALSASVPSFASASSSTTPASDEGIEIDCTW